MVSKYTSLSKWGPTTRQYQFVRIRQFFMITTPFIFKNTGLPLRYETQSSHSLQPITCSNSMVTLCTEGIRGPKSITGLFKEKLPITFLIMSHLHTVFQITLVTTEML